MSKFVQYLLSFYFFLQCIAAVINVGIMLFLFWDSYLLFMFLLQSIPVFIVFVLLCVILILYTILTPISAIATFKAIQFKKLTKLQKISSIIFPIIFIPLYSFLVWILILYVKTYQNLSFFKLNNI